MSRAPCPAGLEEIQNGAGRPLCRIERNAPFTIKQVHGSCVSTSCESLGWLTINVGGIKWVCDDACEASWKDQKRQAAAAKRAATVAAAKKGARHV